MPIIFGPTTGDFIGSVELLVDVDKTLHATNGARGDCKKQDRDRGTSEMNPNS